MRDDDQLSGKMLHIALMSLQRALLSVQVLPNCVSEERPLQDLLPQVAAGPRPVQASLSHQHVPFKTLETLCRCGAILENARTPCHFRCAVRSSE